jgi:hypothetical protein
VTFSGCPGLVPCATRLRSSRTVFNSACIWVGTKSFYCRQDVCQRLEGPGVTYQALAERAQQGQVVVFAYIFTCLADRGGDTAPKCILERCAWIKQPEVLDAQFHVAECVFQLHAPDIGSIGIGEQPQFSTLLRGRLPKRPALRAIKDPDQSAVPRVGVINRGHQTIPWLSKQQVEAFLDRQFRQWSRLLGTCIGPRRLQFISPGPVRCRTCEPSEPECLPHMALHVHVSPSVATKVVARDRTEYDCAQTHVHQKHIYVIGTENVFRTTDHARFELDKAVSCYSARNCRTLAYRAATVSRPEEITSSGLASSVTSLS